jgi:(E)-4-hydroxy-3-methylbut-2-enyl-diphosphate synthase
VSQSELKRRISREVNIGGVRIGAFHPIAIQSMTTTDTRDVDGTVRQIDQLTEFGCEIIRVAVPDEAAAHALHDIRKQITIPLVADIHFKHELAIMSIDFGADKIRINPGNIGDGDKVDAVIAKAKSAGIPIRIGVNHGSLERDLVMEYGRDNPEALVMSALRWIQFFGERDFDDIVVSIKSTDPDGLITSNTKLAAECNYPIHLGLTEAGPPLLGAVRSTVALAPLLREGIGDTIRISLSGDPVEDIRTAKELLRSLGIRKEGVKIISCPTCGRVEVDLLGLVERVEKATARIKIPMTIAVMGCTVNGPGEVAGADIGVIGGKNKLILSRDGRSVATLPPDEFERRLMEEIDDFVKSRPADS